MNDQCLGAVLAGMLVCQAAAVHAATPGVTGLASRAQPSFASVDQAPDAASATGTPALPAVSFATQNGLFSISPNGDNRQTLMAGTDSLFFDIDWAPGGRQVAVVRDFSQVFRFQPGQAPANALFDSECLRPPTLDLAWQQDGTTLLIKQLCDPPPSDVPGSLDLYLANSTGPLISLGNLPDTLHSDLYISPDATTVAYVANQHIYTL